ncbi:MAG TPA: metal-dependent transcriptional regulator [Erysipelotrichaceae bacterium]|nr:metal-dependent transcriptional regulator [Erysipelotrichaceae bacterium]
MKYHDSAEMYLETIYLLEKSQGHAHVAEISKALNISKPSVTKAMDQLKNRLLINKDDYGPVTLTDKGRILSQEIYERHLIITEYLQQSLNLSPEDAEENACRMEHVITDTLLESIKEYLNKEELS